MHSFMVGFVRACALYNIGGALAFIVPGALGLVGVAAPASPFWLWLPALFAFFAALVLYFSSFDLERYGAFPYWNGIVRLTFVVLTFALGFAETAGAFVAYLALGDLVLALGAILGIPAATGRSHGALLTNH